MSGLFDLVPDEAVWRLGMTLVHFVWEGVAIALMVAVALAAMRRGSAKARYAVGCAGLVGMVMAVGVTFGVMSGTERSGSRVQAGASARRFDGRPEGGRDARPPARDGWARAANGAGEVTESTPPWPPRDSGGRGEGASGTAQLPVPVHTQAKIPFGDGSDPWPRAVAAWLEPRLGWLVAAWLVGMLGLSVRLLAGWGHVQRMRRRLVEQVSPQWQAMMSEVAARVRISRPVRLLVSATALGPMTVGWLRPVVLVPVSALTGLSAEQVRAVLAHELAHIRRYDYLVNIVQSAIETVLFYHPAVWWVSRRIRVVREHCCDDVAAEVCGGALRYARALERLETLRGGPVRLAAAASGGSLVARIRRLVMPQTNATSRWSGWLAGAIPLVLMAGLAVGVGMTGACGAADTRGNLAHMPSDEATAVTTRPVEDTYELRHFVRFVVGEERMTFQGQETTLAELPELLKKVPNRPRTVLELAYEAEGMNLKIEDEARVLLLVQQLGFAYLSYIGVHPVGSMGSPSLRVAKGGQEGRPSGDLGDNEAQMEVDARFVVCSDEGDERLHELLKTKGGAAGPADAETGVLDASAVDGFTQAVQADTHSSVVASPRLITSSGNRACVAVGTQEEITYSPEKKRQTPPLAGKQPQLRRADIPHSGTMLAVTPTLRPDGDRVDVKVETSRQGELDAANWTQPYGHYGPADSTLGLGQTLVVRLPLVRSRVKFVPAQNGQEPRKELYELVRQPLESKNAPEQVVYVLLTVRKTEASPPSTQPGAATSAPVKEQDLLDAKLRRRLLETPLPADAVRFTTPTNMPAVGTGGRMDVYEGKLRMHGENGDLLLNADRGNVHVSWDAGALRGEATAAVVEIPNDKPGGSAAVLDAVDGWLRLQWTRSPGQVLVMGIGERQLSLLDSSGRKLTFHSMNFNSAMPGSDKGNAETRPAESTVDVETLIEQVEDPTAKRPDNGLWPAEGLVELGRPILLDIVAPIDAAYAARTKWLEFSQAGGQVEASVCVRYPSGPKARWRISLVVFDDEGDVAWHGQKEFENSGVIAGVPAIGDELFHVPLGAAREGVAGRRFMVKLETLPPAAAQAPTTTSGADSSPAPAGSAR